MTFTIKDTASLMLRKQIIMTACGKYVRGGIGRKAWNQEMIK